MEKDQKKQLTLKYKSVLRLVKECNAYTKEIEKNKAKLDKEKEAQVEDYLIRKSEDHVRESEETRDVVKGKLRKFLDELIEFVNDVPEELKDTEEYKEAGNQIKAASDILN